MVSEHQARRLHVLLMPAYYPSPEQPVLGLFMRDLAHAISTRNDVTVLAPPSERSPRDEVVDGIRTIRLPKPLRRGFVNTARRLVALNGTVAWLRRDGQPVDLIHAHHFSTGAISVLVGRMRHLPVVVTENQSRILTGELSGAEVLGARFTYRSVARVLPVSDLQERHLRALEPSGRYEVVPDIVDVDTFARSRPGSRDRPKRQILAVSNLIARKGLDNLVEAIRVLVGGGRDVALMVVGEGEQRPALEAQAEGLPVEFVGKLDRRQIIGLLESADVFVVPTLGDPFAISAVEAMAAGVPVVVTSAAGCADLIEPFGACVVPPADPMALRDALIEALEGRAPVAAGTAKTLRGYCSKEAVGKRLDSIYRSLVA